MNESVRAEKMGLTVAIPTYNRASTLERTLSQLIELQSGGLEFDILVSDNCSSDETVEVLRQFEGLSGFESFSQTENTGFVGNILFLLFSSKTKWTLFLSDEDSISPLALSKLLVFLKKSDPSFVSPGVSGFATSRWIRGSLFSNRLKIYFFDRATAYFSGLVFKTDSALRALAGYSEKSTGEYFRCYPHSLIALAIMSQEPKSCYWFGERLIRQREELPTTVNAYGETSRGMQRNEMILQIREKISSPSLRRILIFEAHLRYLSGLKTSPRKPFLWLISKLASIWFVPGSRHLAPFIKSLS